MKRALLLLALLTACGSPAAPTVPPTPPPPVYPSMLGGWGGTSADTWVSTDGSVTGSRTCNENWLISAQSLSTFSGNFQATPGSLADCARSGTVRGTVLTDGSIQFGKGDTGVMSQCVLLSADTPAQGVVSLAGNLTAGFVVLLRCPFRGGTIDYRFTSSYTLSRR